VSDRLISPHGAKKPMRMGNDDAEPKPPKDSKPQLFPVKPVGEMEKPDLSEQPLLEDKGGGSWPWSCGNE
jgi:hypothetical protein